MTSRITSFFLCLLVFSPGLIADSGPRISGRVLSEAGLPLAGVSVTINDRRVSTSAQGVYSLRITESELYRLQFSGEGYFPAIHSFSNLDLEWLSAEDSRQARIPDVTLVERAEGRYLLAFGGDTMMGRRYSRPTPGEPVVVRPDHRAEDALALLQHMKPYLELADYTSVNLETQIMDAPPEGNAPKSFVFHSPPELLHALKLSGVDHVTLGNNHTFDYLQAGLQSTLEALAASGLGYSGAGLTEAQSLKAHRVRLGDRSLSYLGYVGWAGNFSPNQVAQGTQKGGAAFGTSQNIKQTVLREVSQLQWPIVQYHGSREYTDEPTGVTESRLKQAIDQGAIVAIGHHPHIVQGFEIYKDRLIAYSMGNFMFDQFHYATGHSYLLYVWMDGDRLHRAEIMPLHIKGYVPMPATDSVRQSILKRSNELSSRRGIELGGSGGNAVILPAAADRDAGSTGAESGVLTLATPGTIAGDTVQALYQRPWNDEIRSLEIRRDDTDRVRLGMDLLPTGHLESHFLLDAPDRAWVEDGTQTIITTQGAPSGRNVMQLRVPAGNRTGTVGMRTFEYTFEPGTPTSFVVKAAVDSAATVTAWEQWRKRDENRFDALENAKLRPIGAVDLEPGDWRELRFDFDSPRVTAISYRVVLHISPQNHDTDLTAWFDDISLIEWLSPPLDEGPVPSHVATGQASHVDLIAPSP